jgi:protein TonB
MGNQHSHGWEARLAGLFVVLAMHGAVLYSFWRYPVRPPASETATLFVDLLKDPPKLEPAKPRPPKHRSAKQVTPAVVPPAPQLAAQAPLISPADLVAPVPPLSPLARIEATPEPAPAPPRPAGPVVLSGDLAVSCPERRLPAYPSISRRLGEEGRAVLRVELDQSGRIDRAEVQSSSGYARLDKAALAAVRHWRCNPAQREGTVVRAVALQPFNFVLEGQ